jgi:AraC family transcriptional regulator
MNSSSTLTRTAPGSPRVVQSSASRGWRGLILEQHFSSPGVRSSGFVEKHQISMLMGCPARFEYTDSAPLTESAGTLTIIPTGHIPSVRLHTSAEILQCSFEHEFIARVRAEMDQQEMRLAFRTGLRDRSIERLMGLLLEELESPAPLGNLYVDSIALAVANRYLRLDCSCAERSQSRISALPSRILHRVRERIEAEFQADVSLETLAEESGYSRAHFLRMFRVATGITPHQYVLNVRLAHAQKSLTRKGSSLIDIAALCGFSSQSHMTSVFRKHLGVTPAEFRRSQ